MLIRCQNRLNTLENDLELQRRVEIHEVEERKNLHINDLIKNHNKAFAQIKSYYNDITSVNLQVIKNLQYQVLQLKNQSVNNKKLLIEYTEENLKLSEPLAKVSNEIIEVQNLLKERSKDQMAYKNTSARLTMITKSNEIYKYQVHQLELEYNKIEKERDYLYNTFEDTLVKIQQQSEFYNQSLQQKLLTIEGNNNKLASQTEEIISAAGMDSNEIIRIMTSLKQMLITKDNITSNLKFSVIKSQKTFNDTYLSVMMKFKELGISEDEIKNMGFELETLPVGSTTGPAGLISSV